MSKRMVSCLLVFCVLLCAGCAPKKKTPTVLDLIGKPFACTMTVTAAGHSFVGSFRKESVKVMSFTFSEPALLEGLTFSYDDGDVGLSLGRISASIDVSGLPATSVTDTLFDLYGSDEEANEITLENGLVILRHTGKLDVTVIEFDPITLVPQRLYTEKTDIEIVYSDYELLPGNG